MFAVESVDRPVRSHEGVLHEVFGVRSMIGQRVRHPQQHRNLGNDMALEQLVCAVRYR